MISAGPLLTGYDTDLPRRNTGGAGWLRWLRAQLDAGWRRGEWDGDTLLFTGDVGSDRTAVWPCCTPGCPTATRRQTGRCETCRRTRAGLGIDWAQFDAAPPPRVIRPVQPGRCTVAGCEGDLHCRGMCFRHERQWDKDRSRPVADFIAAAEPLARAADCLVSGCGRESIARRGLCRFHQARFQRHRRRHGDALSEGQLAAWIAAERPRLSTGQFSLAGLCEPLATELLYGLQQRDQSPPPLDPTLVRILLERLTGAETLRTTDPQAVCESGGTLYNSSIRGLFRDLGRHVERAWAAYGGVDPFAGDVWQVALLDLQHNASRPWPSIHGVVDFTVIEAGWLRTVVKDWARTTRPSLSARLE